MIRCSNKVNPYLYSTIIAVVTVLADIVVKYSFKANISFIEIIVLGVATWIIFFYAYSVLYKKQKKK